MISLSKRTLRSWIRDSSDVGIYLRRVRRSYHTFRNKPLRIANVAMLHAGRCGSSVLADLLNQHPLIHWRNEPFEAMGPAYRDMKSDKRAYHLLGNMVYSFDSSYFGFDSKYLPEQHLRPEYANKTIEEYVALLDFLEFNYFILLNRENHLRRAVSTAIGQITGQWNSTIAPEKATTIHLDTQRFVSYGQEMPLLDFFKSLDRAYAELLRCLKGYQVLELSYERDIQENPEIAYLKTCEFLQLNAAPVSVRLKKMNPLPITALIDNYDDVAKTLCGTKYEWMLTE